MSMTATEPLPPEVGQLGNFEARMVRTLRAAVEDWDEVCSSLGAWESRQLVCDDPSSAKKQHEIWVTEMLSWGQLMQHVTEYPGFPDRTLAARVNARMRHLQDKLALWHREMTPAEEDRILRTALFQ